MKSFVSILNRLKNLSPKSNHIQSSQIEFPLPMQLGDAADLMKESVIREMMGQGLPDDIIVFMGGWPNGDLIPSEYFGEVYKRL